jgi:hypothetical protein
LVIVVAGLLTGLTLVSDAHAKHARCSLSGANLAHSRTIKVVKREREEEFVRLVGCVRPNGKPRVLADLEASFTTTSSASLEGVGGTWVLVRSSTSNQYGGTTSLRAVNVRTGRSYSVAGEHYDIGQASTGTSAAASGVTARGFSAVVLDDIGPTGRGAESTVTRRRIVLIDSRGRTRELDAGAAAEIDPRSLVVDTHTVLWSHGGAIRYARF